MQYENRFFELRYVHNAKDSACAPDADLAHTGANIVEGLPVFGIKPDLQTAKLEACFAPCRRGKLKDVVIGRADPADFFLIGALYKILYSSADARGRKAPGTQRLRRLVNES